MNSVKSIEKLADLLSIKGIVEQLELRSTLGLCALHGGGLERGTDIVAREVAKKTGASYYALVQPEGLRYHLPSSRFDPTESPRLTDFLQRSETVLSIHGYGREDDFWAVLLGGKNRPLAHHLASHLRGVLPEDYRVVDEIEAIPKPLRGLHPNNPVNLVPNKGVQVEIPPGLRWNSDYGFWSDVDDTPRAEQLDLLINGLVTAIRQWPSDRSTLD